MVSPFADRRGIDRTPHLNGARGRGRRWALVKSQHLVVPGKPYKADEASARCQLIPHNVLVMYFQKDLRWQYRAPVLREAAKCKIVFRQFDLPIRECKLALKVRFVNRPACVHWVPLDQNNLGR